MGDIPEWIENYLSGRQIEEMEFFFADLRWTRYHNAYKDYDYWKKLSGPKEIQKRIRKVKERYDEALALADDDPGGFLSEWDRTVEKDTENGEAGMWERVLSCVEAIELDSGRRPSLWASELGGRIHIFDLIDSRHGPGNPDFELGVSHRKVTHTVDALLAQRGFRAYPANKNAQYPPALIKDASKELEVSTSTVRRRLDETPWTTPDECYLLR